jgi:hypothetical protein
LTATPPAGHAGIGSLPYARSNSEFSLLQRASH